MPKKLLRVQVTLTPEQYEAVSGIAAVTRQSMSRIIGDVLEPHLPLLLRARGMLQSAATLTEEARTTLRRDIAKHEGTMERAAASAFAALAATESAIAKAANAPGMGAKPAPRRRQAPAPMVDLAAARKKHLAARRRARQTPG
jgi:hypothetical protein